MSLTENGGTTMLVQPSGYGGGFGGGFGGDGWWIILLLLCGWGGMGAERAERHQQQRLRRFP